jgi:ClpP class serine protease
MYEKNGIKVHVISTGPFKGAFTDGAPVTDDQLKDLREDVEALNEFFLAGVSRGRKMNIEQVRELATGQIWIADEAQIARPHRRSGIVRCHHAGHHQRGYTHER